MRAAASRKLVPRWRARRPLRRMTRLQPQTLNPAATLTSFSPRCVSGSCHCSRWRGAYISGPCRKCCACADRTLAYMLFVLPTGAGRRGRHGVPEAVAQAGQRSAATGAFGLCTVCPPKLNSRRASIRPVCLSRPSVPTPCQATYEPMRAAVFANFFALKQLALRLPALPGSRWASPRCAAHYIAAARPPSQCYSFCS
jgi:hypothetical protein